jgi:DNA-binding MarR family transcriptional regulator
MTGNLYQQLTQLQRLLHKQQVQLYFAEGPFADPTRGQGQILHALKTEPNGISARELAFLLGIRVTSLNELLSKLEKAELITRVQSESDGRISIIKLTDKGNSEPLQHNPDSFLDCFSEEEKVTLSGYLERLIEALQTTVKTDTQNFTDMEYFHHRHHHHTGHEHAKQCSCPNTECENHGKCGPCKERHHAQGGKTYCEKQREGGGK